MQRGWKEWESRANEGKQKCGWRCFALVQVGWMTGQEIPSPPHKPGCPPQAATHHGSSWVCWGTVRPLWFGFLGIERQNYVMSGKCRINQKHWPPVNNTFFINLLLDLSSISQYFLILLSVSFSGCHFSLHRCKCFKWFLGTGSGCDSCLYSVNYCFECHLYVVCSLDHSQTSNLFYPIQILHLEILWASQTDLEKMKPWLPFPACFAFQ